MLGIGLARSRSQPQDLPSDSYFGGENWLVCRATGLHGAVRGYGLALSMGGFLQGRFGVLRYDLVGGDARFYGDEPGHKVARGTVSLV